MMKSIRKAGRFILQCALGAIALLFVALIAIQIVLIAGINLLSTGNGSAFIAGQINEAIADSGYTIAFDGLFYDPVRGITVHDLAVSDGQGIFLTLDRISAGIYFVLGPLRTLDIHAKGGTLTLDRLPVSLDEGTEDSTTGLTPFELPDIYIRKLILSKLSFEQVVLDESIAGTPYIFSPSMKGRIVFTDAASVELELLPGLADIAPDLDAPERIFLSAALVPETLEFTVNDFSVIAPTYSLNAHGNGDLGENHHLSIFATAKYDDLSKLTSNALDGASAELSITGPMQGPALDLSAVIVSGDLKQRGLSDDIKITLKTADISQGIEGDIIIETAFHDDPVALKSTLTYDAPLLRLRDIQGSAPDIAMTGEGIISTQTGLFDGTLKIAADNLGRYSDLAGVTLAGKMEASAVFMESGDGNQSVDLSVSSTDTVIDTIRIGKLSAQASIASLNHPWPQSAKVNAASVQVADDLAFDTISASVTDAGEDFYRLSLKGAGQRPVTVSFDGTATLSSLEKTIPDISDIAMKFKSGSTNILLSGAFSEGAVDLKLLGQDLSARDLPVSLPVQFDPLRIDLQAAMTGSPDSPVTNIDLALRGLGAGEYQNASIDIKAQHDSNTVTVDLSGQGTGIRKLVANGSFPMTFSLLPSSFALDTNAAVAGTIDADFNLESLSPLFLSPTQSLSGGLSASGTISGTLAAPQPSVALRLREATFEDNENGIVLANLSASGNITNTGLTLDSLSATDGKDGTVSGGGSLSFGEGATNIGMQMRNFNIPRSNLANGIIDADLLLKGSINGLVLSGKADIAEMNVLIPERFSSNIPELNIIKEERDETSAMLEGLALDITIDAHNQVFVRGWGLDAEFGGAIAISGTASKPLFNGTLESRRGRYEEFGKRFTLERANLRFQGDIPPSPYLDIEATAPAGDVTASILLTGPVQTPSIKFASTPALPEDEVLSRILFGKDSSRISPYQAVQLAQAIRRFSGQGGAGFDPLGLIRSATGLDDISVETDDSGTATVEAGKYLTDNVYLEFSKGKSENSGAATIQIEVTPSINIESRIGQDAQGGGGLFWKHDY